jgi:hypothetical protein
MQIFPIQISSTDWQTYLTACQSVFLTPSRKLDASGMSLDSPASFLATLDSGQPAENLRNAYIRRLTEHAFATFMIIDMPIDVIAALTECGYIAVKAIDLNVHIMSGTLTQYYNIITCLSIQFRPTDQRLLANSLFLCLDRAGYRPIFHEFERITQPDGTFALCRRK